MAKRDAYQWQRDFIPITMISLTPIVLQVNPKVPVKTLKEFFDLARSQPGKLNMASPGPGTTNHLLSELAKQKLGLNWATAHYKGNTPATKDLIAGHVDFNFDQTTVSLPYIKAGNTRALAITGNKRTEWLPDVPTFIELGYKDINGVTFTGLLAPKGTPPEIIDSISNAMIKILKEPDVVKKFNDIGAESAPMTPAEFTKFLENEDAVWMPFVRSIAASKK
jgi:tripartite-type tricarboxylate transporter receptor subunit TctC